MTETFLCERLHLRLSPAACAARWSGAKDPMGPTHLTQSACKGCPVGEQNAAAAPLGARARLGRTATATVCGVEVRILPGTEIRGSRFVDLPASDPAWRDRSAALLAFLDVPRAHHDLVAWAVVTRHGKAHLTDLLAWCHTEGLVEGSAREGWRRAGTQAVPAPAAPRAPDEDHDTTSPEKEEEEEETPMRTAPTFAPRACKSCGEDFTPTGPSSRYCKACGPASRRPAADVPAEKRKPRAAKPAPAPDTRLALIRDRATAARRAEPTPAAAPVALTSLDAVADAAAVRQIRAHRERLLAAFDLVIATIES